ncbi:glycerol-3-phosphate dehydrogenase [Alcanivorax sp. S71-1-4]|uniref:glycerol-3-phosphate dehydrogenase/oxidase n=1 Tax=Alcanivorax sp. S71-1-4 TaxID=1177159 RepID=UPI001356C1E4|nr:glycerol-3-phosphate dehydrogenase/oxidase [Alcanivorax sp. S71-1-4]KAF0810514.1 glycerol-3-phosphate dehydrogenase [Alcanivorax sp. S71-1-4]
MPGKRPDPASLADSQWDLVVIGGGITGAGVLLQAAQLGLKVLLLEKHDFAWGTSSRSSKMVHGGLRYIAQGDIRLTREALRERERLLCELPGLVVRQTYLFPIRRGQFPGRWAMTLVLWLYDRLARIRDHRWVPAKELAERVPALCHDQVEGAMSYTDALTDDSRLVLRVLHEAAAEGGVMINYAGAESVSGTPGDMQLVLKDSVTGARHTLRSRHVINATGAWADRLSGAGARVRPLRGSHLFVAAARLPVKDCLTVMHPDDGRPVFVFPWEGLTCIGTTDLDHGDDLDREPRVSQREIDYLLRLVNTQFPEIHLAEQDIVSTMAGVRPVISSGKGLDPSKERRDHAVWTHDGVITVSGGKLTTFRVIALDALLAATLIDRQTYRRLLNTPRLFRQAPPLPAGLGHPLHAWPQGEALGEQVRWVLDNEMVQHLDDLMLRRTRLGNLLPDGGATTLVGLRAQICAQLGWDEARWQAELTRYQGIVQRFYSLPAPAIEAA